jgi:cytochrome P450/CRP-like cAMP-binding protein
MANLPTPQPAPDQAAPLPPLARGQCIFGNTFDFLRDTTGLLVHSYRELGPVFRLRALWLKYTVIGGFEARDFIRQGLDEKYLTREAIFAEVGRQLGSADFVLGQSGEKHLRFRRLLSIAYSREVASAWVPEIFDVVRRHTAAWKPGQVIPVMDEVQRISFEQYCQVMCGHSLGAHYRDCLRVTDYNMNVGGRVWPFFMYRMPWYRASRQRVLDLMWGMVRERRAASHSPAERPTILDTLMSVRDDQGQPLTDDEVVCYSMYGFAGSSSYMSRVVAFMLYQLVQHPDLLARVRTEVASALADGLTDASDVRSLHLLQAVYHETLRFHPVSQGMPCLAAQDFVYHGKQVKKGDVTVLSQVPMSFSSCPFHRPEQFEPERCLEPRMEHRKENAFHPFGIGHRTCTAMGLVEQMALTQVAALVHHLDFELSPPDYQLRLTVKPLPAPDRHFGLRILGPRSQSVANPVPRAFLEERSLAKVAGHDDPAVLALLSQASPVQFNPNEIILREGDPSDAFYLIARGTVTVSRRVQDQDSILARLDPGDSFGEIGLLQHRARTATVTSGPDGTHLYRLSRQLFEQLVATSDLVSSDLRRLLQKRLASQRLMEALPGLDPSALQRLLPDFLTVSCPVGTVIIREGDPADAFYLVVSGQVQVTRRSDPHSTAVIATLGPGQYFGELGLLTGHPRNASVIAAGNAPVELLQTDAAGFARLIEAGGGRSSTLAMALAHRLT